MSIRVAQALTPRTAIHQLCDFGHFGLSNSLRLSFLKSGMETIMPTLLHVYN